MSPLKLIPASLAVAALASLALLTGAPVVEQALQEPQAPRVGVPGTDLPAENGQRIPVAEGGAEPGREQPGQAAQPSGEQHPLAHSLVNPHPELAFLSPAERAAVLAPPAPSPVVPLPAPAAPTVAPSPVPSPVPSSATVAPPSPEPSAPSNDTPTQPPSQPTAEPTPEPVIPDPVQEATRWLAAQDVPAHSSVEPLVGEPETPGVVATYRQVVAGVPVLGTRIQVRAVADGQLAVSGVVSLAPVSEVPLQVDDLAAAHIAAQYLQENAPADTAPEPQPASSDNGAAGNGSAGSGSTGNGSTDSGSTENASADNSFAQDGSAQDGASNNAGEPSVWELATPSLWWFDPTLATSVGLDTASEPVIPIEVSAAAGSQTPGQQTPGEQTPGDEGPGQALREPALAVWRVVASRAGLDEQGAPIRVREYVLVDAQAGTVVRSSVAPLSAPTPDPEPQPEPGQSEPAQLDSAHSDLGQHGQDADTSASGTQAISSASINPAGVGVREAKVPALAPDRNAGQRVPVPPTKTERESAASPRRNSAAPTPGRTPNRAPKGDPFPIPVVAPLPPAPRIPFPQADGRQGPMPEPQVKPAPQAPGQSENNSLNSEPTPDALSAPTQGSTLPTAGAGLQ